MKNVTFLIFPIIGATILGIYIYRKKNIKLAGDMGSDFEELCFERWEKIAKQESEDSNKQQPETASQEN